MGQVTQEIHFAPGKSSATVEGYVCRSEDDYMVQGCAGQFLSVHMAGGSSKDGIPTARFTLSRSPVDASGAEAPGDMVPMCELGASLASWSGDYPINGTVYISVGSERDATDYTLTVSITGVVV